MDFIPDMNLELSQALLISLRAARPYAKVRPGKSGGGDGWGEGLGRGQLHRGRERIQTLEGIKKRNVRSCIRASPRAGPRRMTSLRNECRFIPFSGVALIHHQSVWKGPTQRRACEMDPEHQCRVSMPGDVTAWQCRPSVSCSGLGLASPVRLIPGAERGRCPPCQRGDAPSCH